MVTGANKRPVAHEPAFSKIWRNRSHIATHNIRQKPRISFAGQRSRRSQLVAPCNALFGGSNAAVKAAEAARAAAAIATARAEAILKVPLWQHSLKCMGIVAVALWVSSILSSILHREADRVEAGEEAAWNIVGEDQTPVSQQPLMSMILNTAFHAMYRPAAVFLPIVAWTISFRALALLLDVCVVHGGRRKLPALLGAVVNNTSFCLRTMEQLVIGFSEVAGIVFGVWVVVRLKERLVKLFVENDHNTIVTSDGKRQERALERIVLPLSGLASWMTVSCGVLMALHVMGINIQPLLTVGGVSGVIVGLSAQSVVSNMISGVNLFLSRPFVVGERIDISHSSGAKFITGYVERVDPMRTILRTDTCMPVMIPNKVLADMIISNESRINKSYVVSNFRKARQYLANISVRYKDMHAVELIVTAMRAWLESSPGVDRSLPLFVGLASLDNHACNLTIVLHTTAPTSRDFGTFRQKLLLEFGSIIDAHDAQLAMPTQITHIADPAQTFAILGSSDRNNGDRELLHALAS